MLALDPILKSQSALYTLFQSIEMPFVPIIASIENNGIGFDSSVYLQFKTEIKKKMVIIRARAKRYAQRKDFNIDSPGEVGDVLFGILNIPYPSNAPKPKRRDEWLFCLK